MEDKLSGGLSAPVAEPTRRRRRRAGWRCADQCHTPSVPDQRVVFDQRRHDCAIRASSHFIAARAAHRLRLQCFAPALAAAAVASMRVRPECARDFADRAHGSCRVRATGVPAVRGVFEPCSLAFLAKTRWSADGSVLREQRTISDFLVAEDSKPPLSRRRRSQSSIRRGALPRRAALVVFRRATLSVSPRFL